MKVPDNADGAAKSRAKALAERIAEQVAPAKDEAEFRELAQRGDRGDLEVVVEALKPVSADGRVVDVEHPAESQTFVAPFARAASHLTHPGQKSGVVSTEFGFHTMMLLERTAPQVVSLDERRRLLQAEIFRERARRLKKELVQRIHASVATSVTRSADALLSTVEVGGHETP